MLTHAAYFWSLEEVLAICSINEVIDDSVIFMIIMTKS